MEYNSINTKYEIIINHEQINSHQKQQNEEEEKFLYMLYKRQIKHKTRNAKKRHLDTKSKTFYHNKFTSKIVLNYFYKDTLAKLLPAVLHFPLVHYTTLILYSVCKFTLNQLFILWLKICNLIHAVTFTDKI